MSNLTLEDIERMEAKEAEEFKKAVDEWRTMKGKGEGAPVVVEAGEERRRMKDKSTKARRRTARGKY